MDNIGEEKSSAIKYAESQKEYNSKTSKKFKRFFYSFEISSMVLGVTVSVFLVKNNINPVIPAAISGISVLLNSISKFLGFQKIWINSRNIAEQIKSELRKYENEINEYENIDGKAKDKILAKRLETIVAGGNDSWMQIVKEKGD